MSLRLSRTWDIRCSPPTKKIVAGKFVPTVKGGLFGGRLGRKKRRITIEIHGPSSFQENENDTTKASNKTSPPRRGLVRTEGDATAVVDLTKELKDDDRIVVRILKKKRTWGLMRDSDDSSDSEDEGDLVEEVDDIANYDDGWAEYRKYDLEEIQDDKLSRDEWEATLGRASFMERREMTFDSVSEAEDFVGELKKLRDLVKERSEERLKAFQESQAKAEKKLRSSIASSSLSDSGKAIDMNADIQLLIEIVSANDLPIADRTTSDPYVVVYLGQQEVHRTKYIENNIHPVWTIDNGSIFVLQCTVQEFFAAPDGLSFYVKDHDNISKNDILAKLSVPQTDLLSKAQSEGNERMEYKLDVVTHKTKSSSNYFQPMMSLRVRHATKQDLSFFKTLRAIKHSKKLGVYSDQVFVPPHAERVKLLKRETKTIEGARHYRVKPFPDPNRPEAATKWLTKEAIEEECMKHSTNWMEAGSGDVGKVYLEILKCDGLPNMDNAGKTDAFACIIYEDAIVNTDVINDELSPRWMPWSQRAFCLNMSHPSSQILIGVMDFDAEHALDSHDPIGRVAVDITNFHPATTYLLKYDLFRSVLGDNRQTHGSIWMRLRIEHANYREMVKSSLSLPPFNYINLARKNDFKTSYFVCNGEENLNRFDMEAVNAYRSELEGYLDIVHHVFEAMKTVLLWRGHYQVSLFGWKVKLPIHSLVAFIMGATLIDNFDLLPSYGLFLIAWLLIATNEYRRSHPSPWFQTHSFGEMWHALLLNKIPPENIADNENEAAVRRFEEAEKERIHLEKERIEKAKKQAQRISEFLHEDEQAAAEELQEEDAMETSIGKKRLNLNPLAGVLLQVQTVLGTVCGSLRVAKSIVLWDESIYAFLIANACLILGLLLIWVPWGFLLRWMVRIGLWIVLGPWMKLVDVFYVRKLEASGDNEVKRLRAAAREKFSSLRQTRRQILLTKERLSKLRAMKRYMFGRYVTKVPQFKAYRYHDTPLMESSATPVRGNPPKVVIRDIKYGQTLEGHIIPKWGGAKDETEKS